MKPDTNTLKIIKVTFRILLGMVFTLSALSKAIDPHGSEYVADAYFIEAFRLPGLVFLSFPVAIIQNAFEFLIGICLVFNVKPRLASLGALIFMIIFTPLTFYNALTNSVTDCGCFGEVIKFSNWGTFIKNLIILPVSIFIYIKTKGESNTYKGKLDWLLAGAFFMAVMFFQYFNIIHLPMIDFTPYKVGTHIPDKMVIPAGEKADEYAVFYKAKNLRTGEVLEISDSEFEKLYAKGDTAWDFLNEGESKLIKKGYTPPIYNFKAYAINIFEPGYQSQEDAMSTILADENYCLLVIAYDLDNVNIRGLQKMTQLINYGIIKGFKIHFLTSSSSELKDILRQIDFQANFYSADPVTLKTMVRSNPGLMLLKKGTIKGKWHYNDIPSIKEFETIINQK